MWAVVFVVLMILIPVLYFVLREPPGRNVMVAVILLWVCVAILGLYMFGGFWEPRAAVLVR
jgi:hypothetical protein